ncbi:MAG: ATP-dependent helicase [Candidatus Saccharibacteria bacterium]|nr:ATP-dependent helicase [Candidatus Saccharibacteria bacterium]
MRKRGNDEKVLAVQKWFRDEVTYEGEPYVIDYEQAVAVADDSLNTIVVARAGSGKTRTLVAKIVYLVAACGVRPEDIMAFVFNANAAKEINERLSKMRVNGGVVIEDVKIASTFHAFSRRIVYKVCKGEKKCGKILAGEKEAYILELVKWMMDEEEWKPKIWQFVRGCFDGEDMVGEVNGAKILSEDEMVKFAAMMAQFVNRAQQKYLGGEVTVGEVARKYLENNGVSERERLFVELGVEVFRRYHWYLLDAKNGLAGFREYGTDFNLIVSWASKLIWGGREEVEKLLGGKKYILIDEYQDFSQLFLAEVEAIRGIALAARLFVVGDDWQAINRFAGSDVEYFQEFEKYFPTGAQRVEITTNYRCDRMVVETARKFMKKAMKENGNFRAFSRKYGRVVVENPRDTEVGYALVPYDLRVSVRDRLLREATERM